MESVSTLHDFVLNLLQDPTALTAFAEDPQALLAQAGLGDITPSEVSDAMPLVLDYAPDHLVSAIEAAQSALPVDLTGNPADAVAQLTQLASTVSDTQSFLHVDANGGVPTITGGIANPDLGIGSSGVLTADVQNGLHGAFSVLSPEGHLNWQGDTSGLAGGLTDLGAYNGLTGGLDGDIINKVTGGALDGNALGGATAFATNLVADPTDLVSHPTDITNALTGSIGGAALPTNLADPTAAVSDTLHSVLANVPNAGDLGNTVGLGGLTDVTSGLTHASGLGGSNPLSVVTDHLGGVSDLVNGAVSNVTSQIPGADALHGVTGGLTDSLTGGSADAHGSVAGDAGASASPLSGISASTVGDTVHSVTGDVTGALHGVVPDLGGDHGLLGGL
ncbi:MAG TPA: IniB N-terminal domain-containing protein [Pseudonocardiaceae bacterium]|nr:IniB N-terminal domain-containing protein [Pseudonocardiaceae bacterium]